MNLLSALKVEEYCSQSTFILTIHKFTIIVSRAMILQTSLAAVWQWMQTSKTVHIPLMPDLFWRDTGLETAISKQQWIPPQSYLIPACHPRESQMTKEVDEYFVARWNFSGPGAISKFRAAGFSRVTCLYFPEALNDRLIYACKLLTVLFLIDGKSESD